MQKIKVQAREIVRAAKRHGITMYGGSWGNCVVAVLGASVGYTWENAIKDHGARFETGDKFINEVARRTGRTYEDLKALEVGYENRSSDKNRYKHNRYFKVGEKLNKLVPPGF